MTQPKISVIVPVYNGARTILRCVESLETQTLPPVRYEIIVVDDGSTDGTVALLGPTRARVVQQRNAGPAAARNRGVAEARGEIVVFTDADCRADSRFLERLVAPLLADPARTVAAQARYRTLQSSAVARLVQLEIEERYDGIQAAAQLTGIGTYGAAYWKAAVVEVGGFDETYRFASGEDFALSYALTRGDRRAVFASDAITYHEHPDSLRDYFRSKVSRGFWRVLLRRQFPRESVRDSYVPRSLIAQVVLVGLAPAVLLGAAGGVALGRPALAAGVVALHAGAVVAIGHGFLRRVWRADRRLAPAAVGFVLVRAAAIAWGLGTGLLHFHLGPAGRAMGRGVRWSPAERAGQS